MKMLATICRELNNWFETEIYTGQFVIEDGQLQNGIIEDGDLKNGQHFRIVGSIFNDGVYTHPVSDLRDETFNGAIWCMAVPNEFLELVNDVEKWRDKYSGALNSPYQSESFGGYSYSMKGSSSYSSSSDTITWKTQFKNELNRWRKI